MKTVAQITAKSEALKAQYRAKVKAAGYRENMGRAYERKLETFIGDVYEYEYSDRLQIFKVFD